MTNFKWKAKNYYTAKELSEFLETVKKDLIGRTVDKIMIMGHIYTSTGIDEQENRCVKYADENEWFVEKNMCEKDISSIPTHNVSLSLDEPLVLCFGNIHFEINYCEFSNAQIGLNTLTFEEISCIDSCLTWKDISKYYTKNIIGQKLSDIQIRRTCHPNECVSHYRKQGEDMYDEIIFVFENGYQLEISSDTDYMNLKETPIWQIVQDFSKQTWNEYSKNEKITFEQLIETSIPIETNKLNITIANAYYVDLEFLFETDYGKSIFWLAEAVNTPAHLLRFLEAIIISKEDEIYFYCEEEGPDTFLFVKKINDKIRFIHLSQRKQFSKYIETEAYKIRQDIITDKKNFIRTFYSTIKNVIKNTDTKQYTCNWMLNQFIELQKGSPIIEQYLENFYISL